MGNFVKGLISKVLLVVLTVGTILTGYAVFFEVPNDPIFWQLAGTFLVLAIALTGALLSSLTLTTRYFVIGILGIAAGVLSAVNGIYAIWIDKSSVFGGLPTSPAEVMSSYVGSTGGNDVGNAVTMVIALVGLALPVINVVLSFSYRSNMLGEVLGVATAVSILGLIIMTGVSTATGDTSEAVTKAGIFLGFFAVIGFIGTLAASLIDTDKYGGPSRHYDIEPEDETLPSALPQSFQQQEAPVARRAATPPPAVEDPVLPDFEYPSKP